VSDVCWTRTTVGGPNYLGGSVTPAIWSVGVAIWPGLLLGEDWASGEPEVCSSLEGGLGRDGDPPGSAALARG
jgi:hypothetical protein